MFGSERLAFALVGAVADAPAPARVADVVAPALRPVVDFPTAFTVYLFTAPRATGQSSRSRPMKMMR